MRLLNKVDGSVLWLLESNPAVSRNLRAEAKHRNIAPERLVFSSYTDEYSDYLADIRLPTYFWIRYPSTLVERRVTHFGPDCPY